MDDATRIDGFFRWFDFTVAGRTAPWRFGTAMFDDEFPRKWDANFLRVERALGGATAADLAAEADHLQAHLEHRDADRGAPTMEVGEASYEDVRALIVEAGVRDIRGITREDAEMLADYDRVLGERIGARYFSARIDGEAAGYCRLFEQDAVACLEDVNTLEEYRGRGAARAVVGAAIDAARAGGAGLIFLIADDADWPKQLYAKLGFDEMSHFRQFTKPPVPVSMPPD